MQLRIEINDMVYGEHQDFGKTFFSKENLIDDFFRPTIFDSLEEAKKRMEEDICYCGEKNIKIVSAVFPYEVVYIINPVG